MRANGATLQVSYAVNAVDPEPRMTTSWWSAVGEFRSRSSSEHSQCTTEADPREVPSRSNALDLAVGIPPVDADSPSLLQRSPR